MSSNDLFDQYIIKQVIFDLKHYPNLLYHQKTPTVLMQFNEDFEYIEMRDEGKSFQFENRKSYYKLLIDWQRISMLIENVQSISDATIILKKYLNPIVSGLNIKKFIRIGMRVKFIIPFNGDFSELVEFYCAKFFNEMTIYNPFGKIEDVGIVALSLVDNDYNINLSIGPFQKDEIKEKISEFRNYNDNINCSLMVDLDLYQMNRNGQINGYLESFLEVIRLKIVKFRNSILNGGTNDNY